MEDESTPFEEDGDSDANDDKTLRRNAQLRERRGRSRSVQRRRLSPSAQHFGARSFRLSTARALFERALDLVDSVSADVVQDVQESRPPPNPQPPQRSAPASLP